jgi:tungstate transport system substrate-binding protein
MLLFLPLSNSHADFNRHVAAHLPANCGRFLRPRPGYGEKVLAGVLLLLLLTTCQPARTPPARVLRLATTTSTYDSGLLDAILPAFEQGYQARVNVIATGTGQALTLGEAGDVDVLLVHAPHLEEAFVAAGHGLERVPVMGNDFVIVGPAADPAAVAGTQQAAKALAAIAAAQAPFASRGDDSGTHAKEVVLWRQAGLSPAASDAWYAALGQGMGATLRYADEMGAYTLTDRGTFLAQQDTLPNLRLLLGGAEIGDNDDPQLLNPYSVIAVNPDKGRINATLAQEFIDWLTSPQTRQAIGEYGRDRFGQSLFIPAPWLEEKD